MIGIGEDNGLSFFIYENTIIRHIGKIRESIEEERGGEQT
jgi:hypothetical protein